MVGEFATGTTQAIRIFGGCCAQALLNSPAVSITGSASAAPNSTFSERIISSLVTAAGVCSRRRGFACGERTHYRVLIETRQPSSRGRFVGFLMPDQQAAAQKAHGLDQDVADDRYL